MAEDLTGKRLGPFVIERRLGQGAMGAVYVVFMRPREAESPSRLFCLPRTKRSRTSWRPASSERSNFSRSFVIPTSFAFTGRARIRVFATTRWNWSTANRWMTFLTSKGAPLAGGDQDLGADL